MRIKQLGINICAAYTGISFVSIVLNLSAGRVTDTYSHQLMRLVLCIIGMGSLSIYQYLKQKRVRFALAIHYLATMIMVFASVWLSGFLMELHPDAYRDIFFNFSSVYVVIALTQIAWQKFARKGSSTPRPS